MARKAVCKCEFILVLPPLAICLLVVHPLLLSFLALYVNSKRLNGEQEINVLTYAMLMLVCMIESHEVLKKNSVFSKAFLILLFSMLCILLQIVYRLVVGLLQERAVLWLDVSVCVGVITSQYFVRFFLRL